MSMKLKALGFGLLAIMATGAFAVMNATAESGGHFVSDVDHTIVKGKESGEHRFFLKSHGTEGEIGCDVATYEGTTETKTVTKLTVTPKYETCYTVPTGTHFDVDVTGCKYIFTVGKTPHETPTGTAHLECTPGGNTAEPTGHIVITHPNCTITITGSAHTGVNQNLGGFSYHTITVNEKHAITLNAPSPGIGFATRYEGGICIFLGTNHTGTLIGSATVEGFDTDGIRVGVTATGPTA